MLQQANTIMDGWLQHLAIFWIPALVGLLTVMAIAFWPSQYAAGSGTPVSIRVLEDQTAQLSPQEALKQLANPSLPAESFRETRLSESPFWIYFTL
ncbi:hypothetical protein RZS08_07565, partial [Arthrospira platensis SPKY1]|nr:hypothetical protein [Arthrospira platensis SPKY1]